MAKGKTAKEIEDLFQAASPELRAQRRAAMQASLGIIRAMSQEIERYHETLAHHLLDLPLTHVLYYWLILRLKFRPWRVLVPASLLAVLLYRLVAGSVPNFWSLLAGGLIH